jgi:hypothetical protein
MWDRHVVVAVRKMPIFLACIGKKFRTTVNEKLEGILDV